MDSDSALSVHNLAYLEELYEAFQRDPTQVEPSWLPLLRNGQAPRSVGAVPYGAKIVSDGAAVDLTRDVTLVRLQSIVDDIVEAYRLHGHLRAKIDPLGQRRRVTVPTLDPQYWGLRDEHMDLAFHSSGLIETAAPMREILRKLEATYTGSIGVEYWHLPSAEERDWLQQRMEATENRVVPDVATQRHLLETLINVDAVDAFLHQKFIGAKRFSVSGGEAVIGLLDQLIEHAAEHSIGEVILGMAHRGRLNVLMNVLGKTPAEVFNEFERSVDPRAMIGAGDVKYHLGYHREHVTRHGRNIYLALAFNPSHLEAITPVISGRVRAKQDVAPERGFDASLGVTIHGDAAFPGQGVVSETLNMAELAGYTTGGVIRVVINNQVGFTTNPHESRSGSYCTDVAHILQVPVFHVNGDDAEAVAYVAELALEFRQRFRRDVIIDLVCYRRFGHNEGDDPTFTQPRLYELINAQPTVSARYSELLTQRGTIAQGEADQIRARFVAQFSAALELVRSQGPTGISKSPMHGMWARYSGGPEALASDADTTITREKIAHYAERLVARPQGFHLHRKLARILDELSASLRGETPLSWAAGELLAYASMVDEGHQVRISGQDAMRGTFSHRHAGFVDEKTAERWYPLQHISPDQARFDVINSPLSEFSVLGFEFGYSLAAPHALVLWEAQFGDFANGAQVIIDQFISSSEDKWNRISGLTLMLPHGYEGQGPEHSSARLERFLQLCAEDNMQICYLTTPAQLFHALRRQVARTWRKPLVLMSPKSLLRYRPSFSSLDDLVSGGFSRVLFDVPGDAPQPGIRRALACSGKVYYDLEEERRRRQRDDVTIIRIEQLYPWPARELGAVFARLPGLTQLVWVQEEPMNMGPWTFVAPALPAVARGLVPRYVGREASASPATGSPDAHLLERQMILDAAFGD